MAKTNPDLTYRKDIDGLRAIAVISVMLFHFGYLPNGYLGVDVFFAISGYLITKILYQEVIKNRFSIVEFYLRRIRRIIPLVLLVSSAALALGLFVMLPDDIENMSQSVFATNFFANNIVLLITSGNYWNVANEYKPLMHTWSLAGEEQFYLLYPLLFLLFTGKRIRFLLPLLVAFTLASLCMFFLSSNPVAKFYSIKFRFFELALGGIGAILFRKKMISERYKLPSLAVVFLILFCNLNISPEIQLFTIVSASVVVLISTNTDNISSLLVENRLMVAIGKISFSLYMWHQVVLAYTRYVITPHYTLWDALWMFTLIIALSVLSYTLVEQPFRNKKKISTRLLLRTTGFMWILTTLISLYLYAIDGIIRDVPELDKYVSQKKLSFFHKQESHGLYNARIYEDDKKFSTDTSRIKVLVIGDSFARDWANILLESHYAKQIEISYVSDIDACKDLNERFRQAKYIYFSQFTKQGFDSVSKKYVIDTTRVWNIGTKTFGEQNGIFYNKKHDANYFLQRVSVNTYFIEKNKSLKQQWSSRYIDLIAMMIDKNTTVPVFTPNNKFISHDGRHLTQNGAAYFASLLNTDHSFKIQ